MTDHKNILTQLHSEEKYSEMIAYCDEQIIVSPDNHLFYGAKGKAYQELEEYEFSVECYSKAIEILPTYEHGFFGRAIGYYYLDNNELSKLDFSAAIVLNNEIETSAAYYLTIICFDIAQYEKAIEYADKYLAEYENWYICYKRALCFFNLNDYERAIALFEEIISNKNEENHFVLDSLFSQALCYSNINDETKELENYSLIIANHNIDSEYDINKVLEYRANVYFSNKQLDLALKDIETILLSQRELIPDIEIINNQIFKQKKDVIICDINNENPFLGINFEEIKEVTFIQSNFFDNQTPLSFSKIKKGKEIGIYILSFSNGEFYVGKTTNFNARIKQHIINHKDLQKVYFKTVNNEILTETETQTIAVLEQNLLRIRNSKQIHFVNIFGEENQLKWKNDLNFNYNSGTRFNNDLVRSEFSKQFKKLQKKDYYDRLISFLAQFIHKIIPNYQASEYNYWNITCLPTWLAKQGCITRINMNSVPIVSIYLTENNELRAMLWASKLPSLKYVCSNNFVDQFLKIRSLQIDFRDDFFEITDGDEIRIWINEPDFESFFNNEVIIESLRLITLRMMNKTGFEIDYKRKYYHCLDLADAIFEKIKKL